MKGNAHEPSVIQRQDDLKNCTYRNMHTRESRTALYRYMYCQYHCTTRHSQVGFPWKTCGVMRVQFRD